MKKLLLLNPFNSGMSDYLKKEHNKESPSIKYGLLSIGTYVKYKSEGQVDVKIIDYMSNEFNGFLIENYEKHLEKTIKEFAPDYIGVSGMFNFLLESVSFLGKTCKKYSNAQVFAGGPCAMTYAKELLENEYFDAVSCFEGEIPILRLCMSDNTQEEFENGISWQTKGKLKRNYLPRPEYICDLDEIPTLDFSLLNNLSQYMGAGTISDRVENKYVSLPIHTSRGCPFNCVFCASHFVHGKKMRMMSAERVIADVTEYVKKYNIDHLEICDDQFLIDQERAKKILKGLAPLNLEVTTESGVSIFAINEEIAVLMKRAGINTTSLALESGCEYTLRKIIDKPVELKNVKEAVACLKRNGVKVHLLIVIGFPGENKQLREESMDFLRNINVDWFSVLCATPIKGSRLHDICVENNYIDEATIMRDGYHKSIINTEDFTADEITEEAYLMNLELNFVNNYNLKSCNYETAFSYFSYVAQKFPFHAFAHYYLAKAMMGLKYSKEEIEKEEAKFKEIISKDEKWYGYAKYFNLI